MATFPKTEKDIVALAENMVAGLTQHAGYFPSIQLAQIAVLNDKIVEFKELKGKQEVAKGDMHVATIDKDSNLDELAEMMKNYLTKAEMDCHEAPEKLTEIGWGTRQQPSPIPAPGTPINMVVEAEGIGEIWLKWSKPTTNGGGTVRNYIVERCTKLSDNNFGPWTFVQSAYKNKAHLTEQPSNARLLYRVKASNGGGESMPSNTVLVVLP
jgi:hypothetical protein